MKLLVVSDNHGDKAILAELKKMYEGKIDTMIHCGDSELSVDQPEIQGFIAVGGNCDLDRRLPVEQVVTVKDSVIFVAHGHMHQVKSSILKISYRAKEIGAKYVFFGHSHLLGAEMSDGILFLNPGSISLPRGGNEKTYALVVKKGSVNHVHFFNERHEELEQLKQTFE